MRHERYGKVVFVAILSRLILILWAIFSDYLIQDFDGCKHVALMSRYNSQSNLVQENAHNVVQNLQWGNLAFNHVHNDGDHSVYPPSFSLLSAFISWDAMFFKRIAEYGGYEFELFHAFFPLYPMTISFLSNVFYPFFSLVLSYNSTIVLFGVLVSNLCFILSVIIFYKLSLSILHDEKISFISSILYSFTPASIFMSSMYTESPFALFSLLGMYFYYKAYYEPSSSLPPSSPLSLLSHNILKNFLAAICFGIASGIRANGILLCGFFIYEAMRKTISFFIERASNLRRSISILGICFVVIMQCTITLVPYIWFQYYGYLKYCSADYNMNLKGYLQQFSSNQTSLIIHNQNARIHEFLTEHHPWCLSSLPHLYGYVQKKYWNVGFLKYYEFKQIPNFLLAAPIVIISLIVTTKYLLKDKWNRIVLLGLAGKYIRNSSDEKKKDYNGIYSNSHLTVYIYYHLFVTIYGLFMVHIQIMTRFMASIPMIYWFCASLVLHDRTYKKRLSNLVIAYFMVFYFIGTAIFSNYYPWT